jgi:flavodoxin
MYIVYESRRGRARRAAEAVAEAAADRGVATLIRSVPEAVTEDLLGAKSLVAGCWTRVDTPFGGEPVRHVVDWIEGLPSLDGMPVGIFCTYTFFPHTFADTTARASEVLAALGQAVELKGGKVASSHPFHFQAFEQSAATLVEEMVDHMAE